MSAGMCRCCIDLCHFEEIESWHWIELEETLNQQNTRQNILNAQHNGSGQETKHTEREWTMYVWKQKKTCASSTVRKKNTSKEQSADCASAFNHNKTNQLDSQATQCYPKKNHQLWMKRGTFGCLSGHDPLSLVFAHLPVTTQSWKARVCQGEVTCWSRSYLPKFAKVTSVTLHHFQKCRNNQDSWCCSFIVSAKKMPVLALQSVTFFCYLSDDASVYAGFDGSTSICSYNLFLMESHTAGL